ncbi:hypothetical protein L5515_000953 [Caenorhabditis briggsae]|uniref:Piwi domain-containing protein n=1 Tax=Caenorhabditis briggsae TaxID=6238 RepID=A0AAE9J317_CAEBR|nr:hypothetical protein L5515_000953 [Caenorhabditis briggsae]
MPSKANKRKAAAERSAQLAAEAVDTPGSDVTPANVPATAPVSAPTRPAPPTEALAALGISTDAPSTPDQSSPSYGKKKHVPYELPAKLTPLQKTSSFKVITNSYPMEVEKKTCYRYDVHVLARQEDGKTIELTGSKGSDRKRQSELHEIINIVLRQEGTQGITCIYDGAATIYANGQMKNKKTGAAGSIQTTVESSKVSEEVRRNYFCNGQRGSFHVLIEPNTAQSTLLTTDVLHESLNSTSCPVTQMCQIALGEEARLKGFMSTEGGNELFDKPNLARSREGIETMDGVGASVKIATGQTGKGAAHVVIDYKKKQFFAAGPLVNHGINWNDSAEAKKRIKNLKIGTTYSSQVIRATGVSKEPMSQLTFIDRDGNEQSVMKTASELSGIPIAKFNKNWPAVQVRKGRVTFSFPIEVLRVLPNQKLTPIHGQPPKCEKAYKRYQLMDAIGKKACLLSPNNTLSAFGMKIQNTPIVVDAVAAKLPTILYKDNSKTSPAIAKQAKWEIGRSSFILPKTVNSIMILFNNDRAENTKKINILIESLSTFAKQLGVVIGSITSKNLAEDGNYNSLRSEDALRTFYAHLKEQLKQQGSSQKPSPYVIYVDHSSEPYHQLLKYLERKFEVMTQHLNFDKALQIRSGSPLLGKSTMTNILMKINLKNGGLNHKVLPDPSIDHLWGDKSNTLIISYDVCHSSGKVYKKGETCFEPSCVGFGYNGTSVPEAIIGDFHYQLPRNEQVDPSVLTLRAKLMTNAYVKARKMWPANVLILRDGVSEGQNAMVRLEEFPAIQKGVMDAFKGNKDKDAKPAFALLVVLKTNSNRLYLRTQTQSGIENVPPMTAVDHTIVKKEGVEMVMVCHHPLNGTAQPVLINMLVNEKVFKTNDQIVNLMGATCCAHQVSTGITSIPEPICAADDYAKRGADLFTKYQEENRNNMPTIEGPDGVLQLDFDKITRELCFEFTRFKLNRMA